MKKFILLVSAWLGFATTATVHAQVESTPYAFTNTAREVAGDENRKGELTRITLPTRFTMQGWTGLVIYDDPEGFVLNDDTKMLYADWSEFTNDAARMSISYTAVYEDEDGTEQTVTRDNWEEWVNVWKNTNQYDLTTFSQNNTDPESMWSIRQNYPEAVITIRTIKINNFAWNGGIEGGPELVVEYGLESLNIAGEDVTELPAKQENAKFYGGEFTVVNSGGQACNFNYDGLEIPEKYQGGYVRIDFGAEPENVWSLNLAFSDAEGQGVDGGWTDINGYVKKIGLSRYYKIPEGAVKTNPQIWKSSTDGQPWTVNVAGLYLTNGFDISSVYTDEFFPLEADEMKIDIWGDVNAFDDETKQLSIGVTGAAGWWYNSAQDFSGYNYAVVVLNEPGHDDLQFRFFNENNYWTNATEGKLDNKLYASFKLDELNLMKDNEAIGSFNPSQVYIACFWAAGWGQDYTTHSLSHVFLTNTLPDWENPDVRTTKANNYGTVCFEYPTVVSGAYIYTVEGKDAEGTTLYLKPYNGVLTAGVPYIYRSINEEGVNFYQMKSDEAKSETPVTRNGLVGCLNTTVSEGGYALHTDNAWYKIDAQVTFTNRAYLNLDAVPVLADEEAAAANVNRMVLGDWETTGIDEVKASPAQVDDEAVYNLSGIKMDADNLPKGIYIRGGKKFIVK